MLQNLVTMLMTTIAVCLMGCQGQGKSKVVRPTSVESSSEKVQEVSPQDVADMTAEDAPFILDDSELEEIIAGDAEQELLLDPVEGILR